MLKKLLKKTVATVLIMASMATSALAYTGVADYFKQPIASAEQMGIIPRDLLKADLSISITRAEFCHILMNTLEATGRKFGRRSTVHFSDTDDALINAAYKLGIVSGKSEGIFAPDDTITRLEMFVMMQNLMDATGNHMQLTADEAQSLISMFDDGVQVADWGKTATAAVLKAGIVNGVSATEIGPMLNSSRAQAIVVAVRFYDIFTDKGTAHLIPPEPEPSQPEVDGFFGLPEELFEVGYSRAKEQYIFGDMDSRYTSASQAEPNMVTVGFPVWRLDSNGQKYESTATVKVHEGISQMIVAIFTEIFNGDERFPIKNVGGYAWRGGTSEHNYGLAVDINYNENYMIKDGEILSGSLWEPGENPYSIPEDGDVAAAFAKYGFTWGGTAWKSNNDYMHFSYQGH